MNRNDWFNLILFLGFVQVVSNFWSMLLGILLYRTLLK